MFVKPWISETIRIHGSERRYFCAKFQSLSAVCITLVILFCTQNALAITSSVNIGANIIGKLQLGEPVDVLILLDDSAEQAELDMEEAHLPHISKRGRKDYEDSMSRRSQKLDRLKQRFKQEVAGSDLQHIQDYSVLPIQHLRLRSIRALQRLLTNPRVKSIDENKANKPSLTQSLPLIGQPTAAAGGYRGTGTSVCVLDTGIQPGYFSASNAIGDPATSSTPFVMCSSVADQTACNVLVNQNVGAVVQNSNLTHGTNVSGIVLGVAPGTKIISLNVFSPDGFAYTTDITAGLNWCTVNRATYNIVSLNMSLGTGQFTSVLPTTDAEGTAVAGAITSGISVVASSGNNGYTDALSEPAAYSGVVSVGAVYDANVGGQSWSTCTDATTAADKVPCFSNSASFLTILAPGALAMSSALTYEMIYEQPVCHEFSHIKSKTRLVFWSV
jgi:hypothetical protein